MIGCPIDIQHNCIVTWWLISSFKLFHFWCWFLICGCQLDRPTPVFIQTLTVNLTLVLFLLFCFLSVLLRHHGENSYHAKEEEQWEWNLEPSSEKDIGISTVTQGGDGVQERGGKKKEGRRKRKGAEIRGSSTAASFTTAANGPKATATTAANTPATTINTTAKPTVAIPHAGTSQFCEGLNIIVALNAHHISSLLFASFHSSVQEMDCNFWEIYLRVIFQQLRFFFMCAKKSWCDQ